MKERPVMPANELKPGMKCYAKQLSIHIDGHELIYSAPRGTKFAVIIMNAEKPDNAAGISANDFIRSNGWSHESDGKSDSARKVERG
ncbi:hypothetical protein ACJ8LH_01435 [Serratia sp. CY49633]|uniref:hypothetical protein n=1 Tax=Serratia sp. CY49633 TaxID=3383629 RepID=UPI003F9ED713